MYNNTTISTINTILFEISSIILLLSRGNRDFILYTLPFASNSHWYSLNSINTESIQFFYHPTDPTLKFSVKNVN